ncbi:MAG: magnesium/cobalt transporter CorA [Bacteroidetes bacterium]|jgi:magnesium transporter|nr:magnesium/cobalt transporter CorA [Bacteroidota bacterium]
MLKLPALIRNPHRKLGLPPGTVVFTGEQKVDETTITLHDHDGEHLTERPLATSEDTFPYRDTDTLSWINIDGLHDVELLQRIGEHYGLSNLVIEDIAHTGQRPRIEEAEEYLYLVVKMLSLNADPHALRVEQVSVVIGPTWVLSFQECPGDVFDPMRKRLQELGPRIYRRGASYLGYALLDVIVDHYFVVLEGISDTIEDLEEEILEDPRPATQHHLRDLHRELILIRKAIWPTRDLLSRFERSESALLTDELRPFLGDLYDHGIQALDIVESLRDVLAGVRDTYQSAIGNRMNEIMKVLTIIGTIFIPLTFLAGVYGMNFENMPELQTRYGYPILLALMLGIALALLLYFRKREWL